MSRATVEESGRDTDIFFLRGPYNIVGPIRNLTLLQSYTSKDYRSDTIYQKNGVPESDAGPGVYYSVLRVIVVSQG